MDNYSIHDKVIDADIDAIKTLIEQGTNLDQLDLKGNSPLHWAVITGSEEIVRLLLESGANPNNLSLDGFTPTWSARDIGAKDIEQTLVLFGGEALTQSKFNKTSWFIVKNVLGNTMELEITSKQKLS